ncbi:hypothetical protein PR202_ga30789 [Eleusine coracana subsp. coracana]|uniref:X8 domain-containing protein n=1 Tax=Eleusine coracana subsp. coracana TaxID=191504 RepID=A0AAV5DQK0_ELECO|nr:hypothetical protein PR202_ga30789 [Eleusine coracana subsp. coracana]
MEFACSESNCSAIQGTGGCTHSDSVMSRASVAMNAYYQAKERNSWNCFFNGTGLITITDPSKQGDEYLILGDPLLVVGVVTWILLLSQVLAVANMSELG